MPVIAVKLNLSTPTKRPVAMCEITLQETWIMLIASIVYVQKKCSTTIKSTNHSQTAKAVINRGEKILPTVKQLIVTFIALMIIMSILVGVGVSIWGDSFNIKKFGPVSFITGLAVFYLVDRHFGNKGKLGKKN